jgi:hypothetical protein
MLLHRKSIGDAMASMPAHGTSHNFQFDAVIPPGSSQDEVCCVCMFVVLVLGL